MKRKLSLSLFCLLVTGTLCVSAQSDICESGYMPFRQDIAFELTSYDKKGKVTSVAKHHIIAKEQTDAGFEATVETEILDEKGNQLQKGNYDMICKDGTIYVDMRSMLDPRQLSAFSSMEMEINGDALQFPNRLEPGQNLPDGSLNVKMKSGGVNLVNLSLNIINRKVGQRENVTTPAGTFECIKITQDTELKNIVKKTFPSATWYAPGVGMVKSENYDKKGQVESSTILTKFER